jgi:tetratricopeptide (TPR) repeat protein
MNFYPFRLLRILTYQDIVIAFMLLHLSILSFAQESSKDSKSYSSQRSTYQADDYLKMAEAVKRENPSKAIDYVTEALSLSIKNNDEIGQANSFRVLAAINYQQGLYKNAILHADKGLKLFMKMKGGGGSQETEIRKLLAMSYEGNKDFEEALGQYAILEKNAYGHDNTDEVIFSKNRIASIYLTQKNFQASLKYFQEVLKIEENRKNRQGVIDANNNIGNVYLQQEKTGLALDYYERSQGLAAGSADKKSLTTSNENISKVYRKEKKYEEELELRQQNIVIKEQSKQTDDLEDDYLEVAKILVEQKKSRSAIPLLEKSIAMSEKSGKLEKKGEAFKVLSEAFNTSGNHDLALQNYMAYVAVVDTIYKRKEVQLAQLMDINDQLNVRQKMIETLEKDSELQHKEIELLRSDRSFKQLTIYALASGLLLVFGASFLLFRSSRKRRIANQLLALKSLRSQMNPHFIFNALNSVNSYISKNDERAANKYLSDFSKLMRIVMENSQHDFIPLSKEVQILELYLNLEHVRFKDKFDYSFEVDPAIELEQIHIPPMLIQPYIENAVWHGLRYKHEKGELRVHLKREANDLKIIIEDNGIGRKKSQELKTVNQKENISTGLKNIQSRINILNEVHGTKLKVEIMDLCQEGDTGTKVVIVLPYQLKEELV